MEYDTVGQFGAFNLVRQNILHELMAFFNHGQVINLSA